MNDAVHLRSSTFRTLNIESTDRLAKIEMVAPKTNIESIEYFRPKRQNCTVFSEKEFPTSHFSNFFTGE